MKEESCRCLVENAGGLCKVASTVRGQQVTIRKQIEVGWQIQPGEQLRQLQLACHVLRYHMIDIDLSKRQGLRAIYASSFVSQPNSMPNIKFDLLRRHLSTARNRKGNVQSSAHTVCRGLGYMVAAGSPSLSPINRHRDSGFWSETPNTCLYSMGSLLGQIRISNDKRRSRRKRKSG